MARGKGSSGNKYARVIRNKELIGKGSKETVKDILARGPKNVKAMVKTIVKQGPTKSK